jgi:phosphoglucosamine mutase
MKYFGTDGIRGKVNSVITPDLALKVGTALGNLNEARIKVLIGMDTRQSCLPLANAIAAGINSTNSDAVIVGVIPTPGISYLTANEDFDFGIVISASHNSFEDNGIKIFDKNGQKISEAVELKIEDLIESFEPKSQNINYGTTYTDNLLINQYIDYLVNSISLKKINMKVALDLANGATTSLAVNIFDKLGIQTTVIGDKPDGVNINHNVGSTNINALQEIVKLGDFDCGFAFDGDGDRIIMVDNNGQVIDGDHIIYLIAEKLKNENNLPGNKIVMTVMTNLAIIDKLNEIDINVEVCAVGDKNVSRALVSENLSLGGEQSGHIIMREFAESGDGILVALQLCEFVQNLNQDVNSKLAHIVLNPQTLKNINVKSKHMIMENPLIKEKILEIEERLAGSGRVLLRASGTEELIRIMVEAKNLLTCNEITREIEELIQTI